MGSRSSRKAVPPAGKAPVPSNPYCRKCGGLCCRKLAMEIDTPENKDDVDQLLWELQFDTMRLYIRDGKWYQLVDGRCMYLSPENRCSIYHRRPRKCREHSPPECEYFGKFWDVMLSTPEELQDYLEENGLP